MKPFDLEKALAGEPVITRDGKQIKEIIRFNNITDNELPKIYALIDDGTNIDNELVESFHDCGTWLLGTDSDHDLFMAQKTKKLYINLYRYPDGITVTDHHPYDTHDEALHFAENHRPEHFLKVIEVEIEE